MIVLFTLRAKGKEERHRWEKAEAKEGRQRVYSEFLGLGTIDCFTAGIRAALNNLISPEPGVIRIIKKSEAIKMDPRCEAIELYHCLPAEHSASTAKSIRPPSRSVKLNSL
ncbi:hypothetical protein Pst134EA_003270 [Puccinia striiformis f. sp. tritici]|uniref:hypothetical protein n=1 Tax=Puccinia striiformis f. sp. tritici TaxID=168172 RepID=UPI002008313D|nr:hypothetical protein Pst134EA_003270 [Puccinia striiformis f. sp. tritici]KAH9472666.1 hypothetical protein Pst134EA_003270 [Puccinia striiformis f. sp. tritici]